MAVEKGHAGKWRLSASGYYLIFGLVYFMGMMVGIVLVRASAASAAQAPFLSGFLQSVSQVCFSGIAQGVFADVFLTLLLPVLCQMVLLYLWGMWAAAFPFALILFSLRGWGVGVLAAYLFTTYGGRGIACYFLLFFPFEFLGAVLLFLGGKECLRLSGTLLRGLVEGGAQELAPPFHRYTLRMLLIFSVAMGVALAQTGVVSLFARILLS